MSTPGEEGIAAAKHDKFLKHKAHEMAMHIGDAIIVLSEMGDEEMEDQVTGELEEMFDPVWKEGVDKLVNILKTWQEMKEADLADRRKADKKRRENPFY